jgi:hypothetical protein
MERLIMTDTTPTPMGRLSAMDVCSAAWNMEPEPTATQIHDSARAAGHSSQQ